MRGLLLRLSSLDADAESAVRVIGFFDALLTGRADLTTLLKSAAELAECPIGVSAAGRGLVLRAEPGGKIELAGPPPGAQIREHADATFWLARKGKALPLDEIVLERFALSGSILLDRTVSSLPAVDDPALVELVLSSSAGLAERSRALHLLGLPPKADLRVIVTHLRPAASSPQAESEPSVSPEPALRFTPLGDQQIALVAADLEFDPTDGLLGIGSALPAIRAPESWREARTALRLASPEQPVVRADQLGGLLTLAERLRPEDIDAAPDVLALDRIAAEPAGDDLLGILRAYCATDSTRKAAALVYRHHSTVAYHLQHASAVLGFELDNPAGRFRLSLALVMRALR